MRVYAGPPKSWYLAEFQASLNYVRYHPCPKVFSLGPLDQFGNISDHEILRLGHLDYHARNLIPEHHADTLCRSDWDELQIAGDLFVDDLALARFCSSKKRNPRCQPTDPPRRSRVHRRRGSLTLSEKVKSDALQQGLEGEFGI